MATLPHGIGNAKAAAKAWAEATWDNVIRPWPVTELPAEAKIAWQTIVSVYTDGRLPWRGGVNIAVIGERQGAGDASRSGRRNLERLFALGLGRLVDKEPGGQWVVDLFDPWPIRKARLVPGDPQRGLFDAVENDRSAALAPEPPTGGSGARAAPITYTSTSYVSEEIKKRKTQRDVGGSGARAAETSGSLPEAERDLLLQIQAGAKSAGDPPSIGDVLPLALHQLAGHAEAKETARAAIVRRIVDVVADPDLSLAVCERIAREIVDGAYAENRLDSILRKIKQKRAANELQHAGKYFVGSMARSFRDHGLPLPFVGPAQKG